MRKTPLHLPSPFLQKAPHIQFSGIDDKLGLFGDDDDGGENLTTNVESTVLSASTIKISQHDPTDESTLTNYRFYVWR